jgi:hypothetical protein
MSTYVPMGGGRRNVAQSVFKGMTLAEILEKYMRKERVMLPLTRTHQRRMFQAHTGKGHGGC